MTTKHTPATPLPFAIETHMVNFEVVNEETLFTVAYLPAQGIAAHRLAEKNVAYLVHSANAYPRLVEALRSALSASKGDWQKGASWDRAASALLRDLGELYAPQEPATAKS